MSPGLEDRAGVPRSGRDCTKSRRRGANLELIEYLTTVRLLTASVAKAVPYLGYVVIAGSKT